MAGCFNCPPPRFGTDDCGLQGDWIPRRALLVKPLPRFTPQEWGLATTIAKAAAEANREDADKVQAESMRVVDHANEISELARGDVEWRFKERLQEVEHWRDELKLKFADINNEIDAQTIYRQRVENALGTMCHVLQVNSEILRIRECRVGIDLVHDPPQQEMISEMKIVEGVQGVLKRTLEFCTEEIRMLRKTNYNLDKELRDKDSALRIDQYANDLNIHRAAVHPQCDVCIGEYSNVDEMDWEEFTKRNKMTAEKQINSSIQLRTKIDSLLRQICEDMRAQLCITDRTFNIRLRELIKVKGELEEQHEKLSSKVREMEGTICKLEKTFEEKRGAVALAQTQLTIRGKRPNLELVKDAVQRRLILEIQELSDSMQKINTNIINCKISLRTLLRNQLEIEDAINVKLNSINIDETKVIPLRKTIKFQEY